ncbi:formyltransferase family protein [Bacillus tianshenii]|nr:formyltransferase family protein [Bacillus tianshenii]
MNKKFVVIGCLEETVDTLNALIMYGCKPDHIITLKQENVNINKVTNYVDLTNWSKENNIPCSYVEYYDLKDVNDQETIRNINPDILMVIGWQRLIPESILECINIGTIGFHGSSNFLPWGRGRSPINWSILENKTRFILHMFFINPGIDDGDIIGMEAYDINQWDTCRSLYYKTSIAQAKLIRKFLPLLFQGKFPTFPQIGEPFYYQKRTPEDGHINWKLEANSICRLVRAVTSPYPGAFCYYKEDKGKVMVWEAQPFTNDLFNSAKKGEVVFISYNEKEFVVKTLNGSLLITKYSAERPPKVGELLE